MSDLPHCAAPRYAIDAAGSNQSSRSGRAMPYRPVRAVGQKVEAPPQSDQNIAGDDEAHNLPSTIITLLCAAALVALAVVITMLPFALL